MVGKLPLPTKLEEHHILVKVCLVVAIRGVCGVEQREVVLPRAREGCSRSSQTEAMTSGPQGPESRRVCGPEADEAREGVSGDEEPIQGPVSAVEALGKAP